jgi:hypothetical protein
MEVLKMARHGIIILFSLFIINLVPLNAQSINRSQYEATTLFDVQLWGRQGQASASKKFKATVRFSSQFGTTLAVYDLDGIT